jgi:hydroxyacyl-ACP dehydratase HTD2-like protein with hotdog domain
MDVASLKDEFVGHQFDEVEFDVKADALAEYAAACGETAEHYVDPGHPEFRAVTNYTSRYHGRRSLPEGFPIKMHASFDAGKSVQFLGDIHPGDKLVARSHIHDIFEKTGRSGGMLFIVHRMEFSNQDEKPVSIVDWRMVVRLDMNRPAMKGVDPDGADRADGGEG